MSEKSESARCACHCTGLGKDSDRNGYSIGARRVWTMNGPPLDDHFVNVRDGRIVSLTAKPAYSPIYDFAGQCEILPGVFNMHTHLELSQLDAPLAVPERSGRRPMADWIVRLMEFRRSGRYDANHGIAEALLRREVLSETVALVDIVPPDRNEPISRQEDLGGGSIWCHGSRRPPFRYSFPELIAWTESSAREKLDLFRNRSVNSFSGLSPHAPQTVCPTLLEGAIELAIRTGKPLAMHLAETPEELQLLDSRDGPLLELMRRADPDYDPKAVLAGTRPRDYLELLSEAPQTLIVHGNYLDDKELRFIADHRETMSLVYCPRSHAYFGHEPYPLKKMLDLGIDVFLGTDSLASAPDLNLAHEIRFVLHRHPEIPPERIIHAATLGPARKLGLSEDFGTLQAGKTDRFAFLEND